MKEDWKNKEDQALNTLLTLDQQRSTPLKERGGRTANGCRKRCYKSEKAPLGKENINERLILLPKISSSKENLKQTLKRLESVDTQRADTVPQHCSYMENQSVTTQRQTMLAFTQNAGKRDREIQRTIFLKQKRMLMSSQANARSRLKKSSTLQLKESACRNKLLTKLTTKTRNILNELNGKSKWRRQENQVSLCRSLRQGTITFINCFN